VLQKWMRAVNGGSLADYDVRLKETLSGSASSSYWARVDKTTNNAFSGYVEISMTFSATAGVSNWMNFYWYVYISTPSRTLASSSGSTSVWNRRLTWNGTLNNEKVTFTVYGVALSLNARRCLAERHGRQARAKPDHSDNEQQLPVRGRLRPALARPTFYLFSFSPSSSGGTLSVERALHIFIHPPESASPSPLTNSARCVFIPNPQRLVATDPTAAAPRPTLSRVIALAAAGALLLAFAAWALSLAFAAPPPSEDPLSQLLTYFRAHIVKRRP